MHIICLVKIAANAPLTYNVYMEFQLICILSSKSIIVCISELPKLSTRWTREATLCHLKAYRDLEWKLSDPKIKNKAVLAGDCKIFV